MLSPSRALVGRSCTTLQQHRIAVRMSRSRSLAGLYRPGRCRCLRFHSATSDGGSDGGTSRAPKPSTAFTTPVTKKTPPPHHRVLVLGAYGTFGTLICNRLAASCGDTVHIVAAGRRADALEAFTQELRHSGAGSTSVDSCLLDVHDQPSLAAALQQHRIDTVIHTCGPFEPGSRGLAIAKTCVSSGANYIDLAGVCVCVCVVPCYAWC